MLTLLLTSAQVHAAKVDAYQKILDGGRYTIRYENFTPAERVTNRNVVELYGKNGLAVETNDFFRNRPLSGVTFGDVNFTEMMTAMVSDAKKTSAQKKYKLMASGTTSDGLTYEDFASRDGDVVSAIRYLFDGDTLTKISFATYGRNEFGELKARRCIVKIVEFSASPDKNLLRLPAGLVDATKR